MTTTEWRGRGLVVALSAFAAITALGCGPSDEVSGIWTATLSVAPGQEAVSAACVLDERPYIKLVLGQYGYDVSGAVKMYPTPERRSEDACCGYVYGGRMRGDELTFKFTACGGNADPAWFWAKLTLNADVDDPTLGGRLWFAPNQPEVVPPADEDAYTDLLLFTGTQQRQLTDDDRSCPGASPRFICPPPGASDEAAFTSDGAADLDAAGGDQGAADATLP